MSSPNQHTFLDCRTHLALFQHHRESLLALYHAGLVPVHDLHLAEQRLQAWSADCVPLPERVSLQQLNALYQRIAQRTSPKSALYSALDQLRFPRPVTTVTPQGDSFLAKTDLQLYGFPISTVGVARSKSAADSLSFEALAVDLAALATAETELAQLPTGTIPLNPSLVQLARLLETYPVTGLPNTLQTLRDLLCSHGYVFDSDTFQRACVLAASRRATFRLAFK
jgi:hypothetical protein